jgi:hypothetical protein
LSNKITLKNGKNFIPIKVELEKPESTSFLVARIKAIIVKVFP